MLSTFYGHWDYWDTNQKITFDGVNKLIIIAPLVKEIDVQQDLYSDWKVWARLRDNFKYPQAFRAVGGDPLPGEQYLGSTYFLINGWRIRTWEGDHRLTLNGNIYTEEGVSPFVPTLDRWNILLNITTSNLVQGIEVGSGGGGLSQEERDQLFAIPTETMTEQDIIDIIDGVWDKVLPNGVTAKEYITYKLLTTNKFVALQ